MLKIEEASKELEKKSYAEIQEETAWKWASRAAASYAKCCECDAGTKRLVLWTVGEEYYHEAVEHASLVATKEGLVKEIRDAVGPYQEDAAGWLGMDPSDVDTV